jgi:hypothetical protein
MKVWLLAGVLFLNVCGPASAQDDGDWDSSALRLKTGGFSPGLVQGIDEVKIEGMGMYPSKDLIDFFGERSEPAAAHFQTFRSRQTTGATMVWGGC